MFKMGQEHTSALPPKADIRPRDQDVCFGPKADMADLLLDRLVSLSEHRGRYAEPEGLGSLEIDDSSNLVGCWTGRSAGLAPFRILST